MADRSSAGICGEMFRLLASSKSKEQIARALWRLQFNYDFSPCQMDEDRALKKLGLARDCEIEEEFNYADGTSETKWVKSIQYRDHTGRGWEE